MSLVPEFEIGLWNAWILVLFLLLHATILTIIFRKTSQKMDTEGDFPYQGFESRADSFRKGLIIFISGLVAYTIVMINWAATPLDKPITSGLYQYSRHPMYITQNIVFIGVGIASASWLFLLLIILFFAAVSMLAPREERLCIKRYGDSYRWYMDKTSRWIGIPK